MAEPTDGVGLAATPLGQPRNVVDLVVTRRRAELANRYVAPELSAMGRLACDATNLRPQAKVFGDPADR